MSYFELMNSGSDLILKNKYGVYSKSELEMQLREGLFTIEELGEIYNLNPSKIHNVFRSLGIRYHNELENTRVLNAQITPDMHQVLLGSLLGDAYMQTPKTYGCGHGINQFEYFYHKAEKLHPFIATISDVDTQCATKKSLYLWTFRHSFFLHYFNRFYSRGKQKKFIDRASVWDLDAPGLAIWYQDDGKIRENPNLCVGDIPSESGQILVDYLLEKFNLHCTLQSQDNRKGYFNIYIKAKSRDHFFSLISPYIIDSMLYKLKRGVRPKVTFDPEKIASVHYSLCGKYGRAIRYSGDPLVEFALQKYPKIENCKEKFALKIKEKIKNNSQISRTENRKILPDVKELKELIHEGNTDSQIGFLYGVSRDTIGKLRRSLKIVRQSLQLRTDQQKRLNFLFSQKDMTLRQVMREVHLSFYTVKKWKSQNVIGFLKI